VTEHFEAFKATALTAAELARETTAPPPLVQQEMDEDRDLAGKDVQASKLAMRVVDRMPRRWPRRPTAVIGTSCVGRWTPATSPSPSAACATPAACAS